AMVTTPSTMLEVAIPNITGDMFEAQEEECENVCIRALRFKETFTVSVGEVMYDTHHFLANIDSNGQVIFDESEPATLFLKESLTGTRLSISLNKIAVTCFGSSRKGVCTNYAATARH
ncbi:MAG: hypothetical protein AAF202_11075, partial [Pseudomonadota bacterium]